MRTERHCVISGGLSITQGYQRAARKIINSSMLIAILCQGNGCKFSPIKREKRKSRKKKVSLSLINKEERRGKEERLRGQQLHSGFFGSTWEKWRLQGIPLKPILHLARYGNHAHATPQRPGRLEKRAEIPNRAFRRIFFYIILH